METKKNVKKTTASEVCRLIQIAENIVGEESCCHNSCHDTAVTRTNSTKRIKEKNRPETIVNKRSNSVNSFLFILTRTIHKLGSY